MKIRPGYINLVSNPGGGFTFPTGQILAPDGTTAAPAYSFSSRANTGLYWISLNGIGVSGGGTQSHVMNWTALGSIGMVSTGQLNWTNAANNAQNTVDLTLLRDAAGILAQRNSTNAQTFRLYGTYTDGSNYERLEFITGGSNVNIRTMAAGTGAHRNLALLCPIDGGVGLQIGTSLNGPSATLGYGNTTTALGNGRVSVGGSSQNTATSGGSITLRTQEAFMPSASSTMIAQPFLIAPTINYAGGGAGWYEAIRIAVTETALPTGQSYLIRAMNGAAGTTDVYSVTRGGTVAVGRATITYSASMTPNASDGAVQTITVTNGTAFTINAPTNPISGQLLTFVLRNTSGGAAGAATWNAVFKMAAWTNPATANSRSITFVYDGTNWVEINRATADVPN